MKAPFNRRNGDPARVKVEFVVAPEIADALMMLRAVRTVDGTMVIQPTRVRRYVAEIVETYVPYLFKKEFGISLSEFRKQFPAVGHRKLPRMARRLKKLGGLSNRPRGDTTQAAPVRPAGTGLGENPIPLIRRIEV
jgi:hypothetical protein